MLVQFRPKHPGEIQFEMIISMSLARWKLLQEQLMADGHPSYTSPAGELSAKINIMVFNANQYWIEHEHTEEEAT